MQTRAVIISQLKSRGIKGKLSKMTKAQLKKLLADTAPPVAKADENETDSITGGGISLAPDTEKQTGGSDVQTGGSDVQTGGGSYKDFMKTELKQHGGNMTKAAKAYREAQNQEGGHYFRTSGKTVTDGKHEHKKDPWPSDKKAAAPKAASKSKTTEKKKKKKYDPVEDPDADITVDLVNKRLNKDRHPSTGRKISGKKASEMQFLLMQSKPTRVMDGDKVTEDDVEQRLDNIDRDHAKEFPSGKGDRGGVDVANIVAEGKRKSSKTKRLADKQPDAFVAERDLDGGHYARTDGSARAKDNAKYDHKHIPGANPATGDADDEPEPTRPSSPGRRVTRNMDPREARRAQRGSGLVGGGWEDYWNAPDKEDHHEFFLNLAQNVHNKFEGESTDWTDLNPTDDSGIGGTVDAALLAFAPGMGEASVLAEGDRAATAAQGGIRTAEGTVSRSTGKLMATPAQAMRTKFASNVGSHIVKPGIAVAGEEGVKGMLDDGSGNGNGDTGFAPPGMQSSANYAATAASFAQANSQPFGDYGAVNPWR